MIRALLAGVMILGLMLAGAGVRIMALEREKASILAAKSKVDERKDVKEDKTKEEGRVVIHRRYLPPAPGCPEAAKPVLAEETIERDPTTTTTAKESSSSRKEEAAYLPPARHKDGVFGVEWSKSGQPIGGRLGYTFFDRVDLAGGYRRDGQDRFFIDTAYRFNWPF